MKKVKLDDVAKVAGVSPTTVSRVLNDRGYISEKTRKKVNDAIKELNYFPNEIARSLFVNKTFLIGVIFPTTVHPFFGELIFHIESMCELFGYKVLLCNSQGREDKEKAYLKMLQSHQVDGIIAGAHNRGIEEYNQPGLALVGIDRYLAENVPVVSSDNYSGGKQATELLVSKGCKKIINIHGTMALETPANLRRVGYESVMKKHGLSPLSYEGDGIIEEVFDKIPNVDGIFASDDYIASNVIREAKQRNIRIPEDLKVVGYDGTDATRRLLPELTTIQQPIRDIAESAVHLLIRQINDISESIPLETVLPIKLIENDTT